MARPTKLTKEITAAICNAIEAGSPIKHAAAYAGVGISTVHGWIAKAQGPEATPSLVEFSDAVQRASARSVTRLAATITRAAADDWRAAAWLLERRAPEEFISAEKRVALVAARAEAEVARVEANGKLVVLERLRERQAIRGR